MFLNFFLPLMMIAGMVQGVLPEVAALRVNAARLNETPELDLAYLHIHTLSPGDFHDLPHVRVLRLSGNHLGTLVPDIFLGLTHLTQVWLDSNGLESIQPGAFNGTEVQAIHLESNPLQRGLSPALFEGLEHLTEIVLPLSFPNPLAERLRQDLRHVRITQLSLHQSFFSQASVSMLARANQLPQTVPLRLWS